MCLYLFVIDGEVSAIHKCCFLWQLQQIPTCKGDCVFVALQPRCQRDHVTATDCTVTAHIGTLLHKLP